jgi:hypothetical protein
MNQQHKIKMHIREERVWTHAYSKSILERIGEEVILPAFNTHKYNDE